MCPLLPLELGIIMAGDPLPYCPGERLWRWDAWEDCGDWAWVVGGYDMKGWLRDMYRIDGGVVEA